ncbi:MAG TPA: MBL fold metallo-hydrolase [Syntrophomonadaceae bacterium]|nr:MBL fold metallo-hydrolase [Syntrophomonadaceae bacterium]
MQVHVLASGSSGNAVYFQMGKTRILIDAGITARRIEQGLDKVGVKASELDAILVTHEHLDHVKGIDVLVRRHHIPVFARPKTWEMIKCRDNLPSNCVKCLDSDLELPDMYIKPFPISHDAVDPVGFCLYNQNRKYVLATDLGVVTEVVEDAINMADLVILESNHDLAMLRNGSYPRFLKKRIESCEGHLSNVEAGQLLAKVNKKPNMSVFLAHLSQENNMRHVAENTVTHILKESGCVVGEDIILHRTYPNTISSFIA